MSAISLEQDVGERSGASALPRSDVRERRFGLDAARALAILLVVVSHGLILPGMPVDNLGFDPARVFLVTGFGGVELFFVLSGFLIGGLLLDIQRRGPSAQAVGIFLVRRWMRTLPLYFLAMIAFLIFPQIEPSVRERIWSYALLVQNFVTPMPASNWFGPSWSLAVEEWSYVALPLLAFYACRSARNPVACAALLLIAAGVVARLVVGLSEDSWTLLNWDQLIRKMVIARSDAVAYGVLAAVFVERYGAGRWKYRLLPVAAVLLGLAVWICYGHERIAGIVGWLVLFPLTGIGLALLMPWLVELPRPPELIAAPIHAVARISYALYLAHWPFVFIAIQTPLTWRLAVYLGGSVVVATVLSYAVEYPIMRLRPRQV